jgi:glycine cleavage system H protein
MDPKTLRFARTHEWAHLDGTTCTVGLSQFAVDQLTDIIYIDLPEAGKTVAVETSFGEIESVKSVNDLYSPVNGEVVEINPKLEADPSLVSQDCYGKGWLVKISVAPGTTLNHLQTLEQYQAQIASEGH